MKILKRLTNKTKEKNKTETQKHLKSLNFYFCSEVIIYKQILILGQQKQSTQESNAIISLVSAKNNQLIGS